MGDEPTAMSVATRATASVVESIATAGATSPRVLVIDDEVTIVELIRHTLRMCGNYDVAVAYNGIQGLEEFYRVRPDCIIVDVKMPALDGYQVVRAIRGDPSAANTPLIILSAMIGRDDRLTGVLSGVDEYLSKPFRPSELMDTLDRVMRITAEERAARMRRLADGLDE